MKKELSFVNLNLDNFPEFSRRIVLSERVFHPNLREDSDSIVGELSSRGAIGKVAIIGRKYIGNAIGFSPTTEQIDEMELKHVIENPLMIYLGGYVIEPFVQGRGYGTKLLEEFIRESQKRGYDFLEGHFRSGKNGHSLSIAKKLGGQELEECKDWTGTGETYIYCRLKL